MIGLKFRDQLPQWASDELDQLVSGIRGFLLSQHDTEGRHTDVTADTVSADAITVTEQPNDGPEVTGKITWATVGGVIKSWMRHYLDPEDAAAETVLRLDVEADEYHVRVRDEAAMSLGVGSSPPEHRFHAALTVMNAFRLRGQSTWAPIGAETAALLDSATRGPLYSVYALQPTGNSTIQGIAANTSTGNFGQVLVLWNDSAFTVTFANTGLVTTPRKLLGVVPSVSIGPGESALFIYDTTNLGWRLHLLHAPSTAVSAWSAGDVKMQAHGTVPSGWLLCDGSAVSRATYAALFAAIGTTWGVGDGSTTFNLPPAGAFPIGTGGTPGLAVGATGGSWNHTHTVPNTENTGAHTHGPGTLATASDGAHTHTVSGTSGAGSAHAHTILYTLRNDLQNGGGSTAVESIDNGDVTADENAHTHGAGSYAADSAGAHTHTLSGATASDGTHSHTVGNTGSANPPYAAFVFVIKT